MSRDTDPVPLIFEDDLEGEFRRRYSDANDRQIAALMASFLEQVPPVTPCDDGSDVASLAVDEELRAELAQWIASLKEYAGDAYPPAATGANA
jgi:hypothetical protein